MTEGGSDALAEQEDHMSWVRTRMTLDSEYMEWIRHGFGLIAVGFGSFAFLDGIVGALGESEAPSVTEPSRIFSLVATAIGVILIVLAMNHNHQTVVEQVEEDGHGRDGDRHAPPVGPDEEREDEGPVQVVKLPHGQEDERHRRERVRALEVDPDEEPDRRALHDDPAQPRRDGRPPALALVTAVGRRDEEEREEGGDGEGDLEEDEPALGVEAHGGAG